MSGRRSRSLGSSKFSGGNQQKTDSGARDGLPAPHPDRRPADARRRYRRHRIHPPPRSSTLRDRGVAVLLVSVELDEILALADRILVMNARAVIVGEIAGADADERQLGLMMTGSNAAASAVA